MGKTATAQTSTRSSACCVRCPDYHLDQPIQHEFYKEFLAETPRVRDVEADAVGANLPEEKIYNLPEEKV